MKRRAVVIVVAYTTRFVVKHRCAFWSHRVATPCRRYRVRRGNSTLARDNTLFFHRPDAMTAVLSRQARGGK
jgi:hypothetical protein